MSIFDILKTPDINEGLRAFHSENDAVLLDVRTTEEYNEGHIPESVNIPLSDIHTISSVSSNHNVPLFVYCHSGARSRQAAGELKKMGYTQIKNIGGITGYRGKVEK